MRGLSERYSNEFARWESRGRGISISEYPVRPEPLFSPFPGHGVDVDGELPDDGRRPTFVSSLVRRLSWTNGQVAAEPRTEEGQVPETFARDPAYEVRVFLPPDLQFDVEKTVQFLSALSAAREPIAFELVADGREIVTQCAIAERDARLFAKQTDIFFRDLVLIPRRNALRKAWQASGEGHVAIVEFALGREFMLPLECGGPEPLAGLVGALEDVQEGEAAVFQVLAEPVRLSLADSIVRAVEDGRGKDFFVNAPEIASGAKKKISSPLHAAVVRIAVKSPDPDRVWDVAANMAGALSVFGSFDGNELIPLKNTLYPPEAHEEDLLARQSRRSGMILNAEELAGLFHFPSKDIASAKLRPPVPKSRRAPDIVTGDGGIQLGVNVHWEEETPVRLTTEQRTRHCHIIGSSGSGKTTALFNLIRGEIQSGHGCAVLDPHGDLIDALLGVIPEERVGDVVVFDPSDSEYVIGFNILSAHSDTEKNLLASDLVSVFRRLSSGWGDQMGSVLHNAVLAFLESDQGGTLADLRRFLIEPDFRRDFLKCVRDPEMVYYWTKAFPQLGGNRSIGSVITRLNMFLAPKIINRLVSVKENKIDFRSIMDGGKIFLAKLSQGAIGPENSYLLGSLLVAKIQQEAASRERLPEAERRYFGLFIDECHHFLTASMADILTGARKYALGLTLCHQELRQITRDPDVGGALVANAFTRVVFRVGEDDARELAKGFSYFDATDLINLGKGEAIARVERAAYDFNLKILPPALPPADERRRRGEAIGAASRATYAAPRSSLEGAAATKAEAPKGTEESSQEAPMAEPKTPPKPTSHSQLTAIADLGKGGAQHKLIQERIKKEAEALGFRAIIEKQILDGAGSIDLLLEREGQAIACEVTVTNTIDYEVGNVSKCLKAGFVDVAVVAVDEEKLRKMEAAVRNSFGTTMAGRTKFFLPDALIAHLKALPPPEPPKPVERVSHGYKVQRNFVALSPADAKAREEQAIRIMAELMRKSSGKQRRL